MTFEEYVYSGTERLRRGYTTGTCAALAAKAATYALFSGRLPDEVSVLTPAGIEVKVDVAEGALAGSARRASCTVIKDAGDDYDITDGAKVCSTVELFELGAHDTGTQSIGARGSGTSGSDVHNASTCPSDRGANPTSPRVSIEGGRGVGRVTKPGLDQPVGNAAINSGPRRMITEAVLEVLEDFDSPLCARVLVEVPEGEEIAKKTFNPHIGVEGGISILGTSGIVEPRSLEALKASLDVETHAAAATGSPRLIITPGNYGEAFLDQSDIPDDIPAVKCANFIGHILDRAAIEGFSEVLVVGHIGKLVKVAGGIMDTHSRTADCRCEVIAAHAALQGASQAAIQQIMEAVTTDACLDILEEEGGPALMEATVSSIAHALQEHLERRVADAYKVGAVIFSNKRGTLAITEQAAALLAAWRLE